MRLASSFLTRASTAIAALLACLTACEAPSEAHSDVPYDDRFGDATTLDLYEPEGAGPFPAVMLIHGGAWVAGSKDEYTDAAKRLAHSGYVAATINYRLAPTGQYPRLVQDCLCALSYLRANATRYKLDPDRVAVMGYSAGGHLASLLGVAADDDVHAPDCAWGRTGPPRAVVASAGPHDLRGRDFGLLFGAGSSEAPELYAHASPMAHVGPNKPPFLFLHGTADWIVQEEQASEMRDALVAAGNDATVYEVAGGGHLLQAAAGGQLAGEESDLTPEGWIAIVDFLDRTTGARR